MELVIRTTGRCNFDCTFCSAEGLKIGHPENGVPNLIKDVIRTIKPNNILISGGEPLLVGPKYFEELVDICDCRISMTSNLKDFYYHPDKWKDIFLHPRIGVVTSFNYGNTRKWDSNTVYTEDKFIEISNKYTDVTGKDLPFIAVLDDDNEDTAIDLARLAKRLNTVVRINNATRQGRQDVTYPRYKLFKKYFDIMRAGLGEYEIYCKKHQFNKCPMNTNMLCKTCIRTCYVDTDDQLHYYDCCESLNGENLLDYKNDSTISIPIYPPMSDHVNEHCSYCELFAICHGCYSQRGEYLPEHCQEMLKLKSDFIKYNWI